MGKGEIARYEQFLLFPQCFQKSCTADMLKPGLAWESIDASPWSKSSYDHKSIKPILSGNWQNSLPNNKILGLSKLKAFADNNITLTIISFSSTGLRPASLCHGPLSVVRPSVHPSIRALTFSLNIFFSETTYRILMKFHRNVPIMVLFRISWNNLISSKTLVAMATKLKFFWNLWKSSCQKP